MRLKIVVKFWYKILQLWDKKKNHDIVNHNYNTLSHNYEI